jgi:hypothetical protein
MAAVGTRLAWSDETVRATEAALDWHNRYAALALALGERLRQPQNEAERDALLRRLEQALTAHGRGQPPARRGTGSRPGIRRIPYVLIRINAAAGLRDYPCKDRSH